MIHICTDGFGKKVEIDFAQTQHIGDVFKDFNFFAFKVTYQMKKQEIEVGGFKTYDDAKRERDSFAAAWQENANKPL